MDTENPTPVSPVDSPPPLPHSPSHPSSSEPQTDPLRTSSPPTAFLEWLQNPTTINALTDAVRKTVEGLIRDERLESQLQVTADLRQELADTHTSRGKLMDELSVSKRLINSLESQIAELGSKTELLPRSDTFEVEKSRERHATGWRSRRRREEEGEREEDRRIEEEMVRLTSEEMPEDGESYGGVLVVKRKEGEGEEKGEDGQRIEGRDSESTETDPSHSQVGLDLHRPDSHANLISRLTQLDSNLTKSRSDYSHACLHSSQLEQLLFDSSTQTSHLSEQLSRSHERFEEIQYEFDRMRDAATRELQLAAEKVHTTQMECQRARDRIRELEEKAQRRETEMWTKETGRRTGGAFEGSSGASNVGSTRGMGRGRGVAEPDAEGWYG